MCGFFGLQSYYLDKSDKIKLSNKKFKIISMGMTLDYNLAIKNGSNMIRIGSKIFGERHV